MIGSVHVIAPPPPAVPDEVIGLLRLAADPTLAQRLIDQREEWAKAHEANEKLVAKIKQRTKLDELIAAAQAKNTAAEEALSEAKLEAEGVVAGANLEALAIRDEAKHDRATIKQELATTKKASTDAADLKAEQARLLLNVQDELDAVRAERKALSDTRAEVHAKGDELDRALAALRGNV